MDVEPILFETRGTYAIITLNREKKLNALNENLYYRLAVYLNEVARRDDIFITVLTGRGRFFSAGADVSASKTVPVVHDQRRHWLKSFVANNLFLTHAFYSHPKILITAMNGPAIGLSAALIAHSDFIYAAPSAYVLTPFTSLGLVAEGGASRAFVQRLGISKANEALIMSKKITADELLQVGFINKIIDTESSGNDFLTEVLQEIKTRLGEHLNPESMLQVKALIRKPEQAVMDAQGVQEVLAGLERWVAGAPQQEFQKVASGQKRHKL